MKPLAIVLITALSTGALAGDVTAAESNEPSLEVTVEITDAAHRVKPLKLSLTLTGDHGCASIEDRNASAEHQLKACRDGGDEAAPILAFDLDRTLNLDKGTERRQFRVKSRLALGRTHLIGRFGEGDQAMEVRATVRPTTGERRG